MPIVACSSRPSTKAGAPNFYHEGFPLYSDTSYDVTAATGFTCDVNRGRADSPLFLLNHWVETALPSAERRGCGERRNLPAGTCRGVPARTRSHAEHHRGELLRPRRRERGRRPAERDRRVNQAVGSVTCPTNSVAPVVVSKIRQMNGRSSTTGTGGFTGADDG